MRVKLLFVLVLVLGFFTAGSAIAQDINFSQFNTSSLYVNPAFAGTSGDCRASLIYRDEWPNISSGYQTAYFSYDQPVAFLKGGLGFNFYNDVEGGNLRTDVGNLMYSALIPVLKDQFAIRPAIGFGYGQSYLNTANLTWDNQWNGFSYAGTVPVLKPSVGYFNVMAGLLIYGKGFYAGASFDHLNTPNESFYTGTTDYLNTRQTYIFGYTFGHDSSSKFSVTPNCMFVKQGAASELLAGLTAKYRYFLLGFAYRVNDAVIFEAGFQNRFLRIAYSFDYTISNLTEANSGGAQEVSLTCWLHYKNAKKLPITLSPPAF